MGIYVFDAGLLLSELARDAADALPSHDLGRDLIPSLVARGAVAAHPFDRSGVNMAADGAYWRDVGTMDVCWTANMDLFQVVPQLNLYDDAWPILSQQRQLPPAKFVFDDDDGRRGSALQSLVASGCIVDKHCRLPDGFSSGLDPEADRARIPNHGRRGDADHAGADRAGGTRGLSSRRRRREVPVLAEHVRSL